MRFELPLFDIDETNLRCPQISDQYDRHCLSYIMMKGMGFHNFIRDEIFRFLIGERFGLNIESLGFLPDESDRRRSADLLTIPSTLYHQLQWHFLFRIRIDFAVDSPFPMTRGHLATEGYAISPRFNAVPHIRYREEGIGFESIIFDHAGNMSEEEARILDSLCKAIDDPTAHISTSRQSRKSAIFLSGILFQLNLPSRISLFLVFDS